MAGLDSHYSARDIETRILAAVRAAGLNPEQCLSPEELGPLDHFHTGGLLASRELLQLAQIRGDRAIILAGGLNARNVQEAISVLRPDIVDVSSGVESAPGVKDHERMREFSEAAWR